MKKNLVYGLVIILMSIGFISCQEDEVVPMSRLEIKSNLPYEFNDVKITNMKLTLTNKTTAKVIKKDFSVKEELKIEEGIYTAILEGDIEYQTKEMGETKEYQKAKLRGLKESFSLRGDGESITIDLFLSSEKMGFVLSEIYFAGSMTPKGSQYNSDKFFEIFNNTDQVLYADGLSISETLFMSTMKQDYTPNIMDDYVAVDAIYTIPGSGKEHPVQPGESILLVDIAKDHTIDNANSFDLSRADFEWFDDDEFGIDVDVPSVPNLIKTYSSSASIWSLHNRGFKSYVLFRMDKPAEKFLADNKYDCTYEFVWSGGSVNMPSSGYKIKNTLVIDAVGCSAPSDFEWIVMSPSLDMSYTHSGDADGYRYGKSVKRKISHKTEDGRIVLQDTNNSAFDFIPTADPTPGVIE